MVAKMILPLLGGSPGVWNTCQFFFQATLLFGYGYSHVTTRWLNIRRQVIIQIILIVLPLLILPITISKNWIPPHDTNPIPWLLLLLILSVGLPFFVVSTTAPLVQKWFADSNHPHGHDPYFLYTTSNLGSMLGLIFYPVLIEPNLSLTNQAWLWTNGYRLLIILIFGCVIYWWRSLQLEPLTKVIESPSTAPSLLQQAQWVLLSFLPSSLLLGVTTYITTDLAAIPLLWAGPLAIYLLTFILTFARKTILPYRTFISLLPLILTSLILLFLLKIMSPIWLLLPLHLGGFFVTASVFHGELARNRPQPENLTLFYWWVSFGGVLGGLFNAIAAPLIFPSVMEYPLMMIVALLLLQNPDQEKLDPQQVTPDELERITNTFGQEVIAKLAIQTKEKPVINSSNILSLSKTLPLSIGVLSGSLLVGLEIDSITNNLLGNVLAFSVLIGIFYAFKLPFWRVVVGVILIMFISHFSVGNMGGVIRAERSFFGISRILYDANGGYHSLLHGTTLHGKQSLDPKRSQEPLTYFYPTGPIGQLFQVLAVTKPTNIAVLGLGVGSLAAYSQPNQNWTFYEIDPTVEKLASDPRYFTFLRDSKAPVKIVLGDGRLRLAEVTDHSYDIIFMDAFSSDSIPVHLVTREALELYLQKLTPSGLIAINITNRLINLEPVIGTLANNFGLSTLHQWEKDISETEKNLGKAPSHWVLLTRDRQNFGNLINDPRWEPIPDYNTSLWTDNFSNIFQVLRIFDNPE